MGVDVARKSPEDDGVTSSFAQKCSIDRRAGSVAFLQFQANARRMRATHLAFAHPYDAEGGIIAISPSFVRR
jgi:hypothetical protein